VAASASEAWVANSGDGTVTRIPLGGQGTTTIGVGNGPSGIAIGPTAVWVTNSLDGTLSRIDADTGVVTTTSVGDGPSSVTADTGAVWVADQFGEAIARVDATTGAAGAPIQMDAAPVAMTLMQGALWVAASAPQSAHRGGTLRFASALSPDSIDPAITYSPEAWQILSLTNDGLVGFERVGGPQGGAIVADLATSVPAPSSGGTIYTFQLRPGIHYSSGASVEPQDFRRAIERELLVLEPKGPVTNYYSGIVGAAGCTSVASCDLTKGIVVNDATRTVTFHLTAPDPEFLFRLALPFADAVPAGTPLTPIGATPVPATGPYMIASYTPGPKGAIELVRNPRFVEWSQAAQPDGFPDRIEGSYGISSAQQVSGVEQGRLDVTGDSPPEHQLGQLDTRYPSQLHEVVLPWTYGFALNTRAPPFSDVRCAARSTMR
jgi:peptide/nickel transport system substrate-binding protein